MSLPYRVPSPCVQVLELIAIPAAGAPEGTQADCDYWWTKFMDAGGVNALWRVVRGSVTPDALDLASGSVFATACVAVAAKLLDYAHEVRACAMALDLKMHAPATCLCRCITYTPVLSLDDWGVRATCVFVGMVKVAGW